MKKVLLLGVSAFVGLGAMAQLKERPIVSNFNYMNVEKPEGIKFKKVERATSKDRSTSRWYDIVDAIDKSQGGSGNIYNNDAYNVLWTDSTIIYPYGSPNSPTYDGVWIKSVQQILDPVDPKFNAVPSYAGQIHINRQRPFKVDSVEIQGLYERAPSKASVVDTLIVSIAYGNGGTSDLDIWAFTSPTIIGNYGDTVRFASTDFNIKTFIAKGTNVWSKKIPLTAANANDTLPNGLNFWRLAPNINVPAGNLVGMTLTFKSGDTWTPYQDTIRKPGTDPKFNFFRFIAFEETAGSFQSYEKGYFNSSGIMFQDTTGWGGTYVPSFAFTSPTWSLEHLGWSYKLSCPTCWAVGVNDMTNVNDLKVYPNPALNEVNFDFTLNEAAKNVNIQISNTLGQVVKNVNVGRAQGQVNQKVSVSDLAKGLYIYTINVDGQKVSNKLMVK